MAVIKQPNILSEKVTCSVKKDLKAMVVKKGRKQGIGDTITIPTFSTLYNGITFMLLNIGIIIVHVHVSPPLPCSGTSFFHHHCLQILYTRENVFIHVSCAIH